MAYVTDTTATPDAGYIEHIRGVDLLIHECYFPDSQAEFARKTGHSHTTPVATLARKAGVRRMVLVHLNPMATEEDSIGLDVARAIFPRQCWGKTAWRSSFSASANDAAFRRVRGLPLTVLHAIIGG